MNNRLSNIALSFQESRILLTAFELGLFTAIGERSRTSADVARDLGTDARATDRLMDALCAFGMLRKKKNKFSNTQQGLKYLVKSSKEYLSLLLHTSDMWKTWSNLTDAVKKGGAVAISGNVDERVNQWVESFIAAMHYRAVRYAPQVVKLLDIRKVRKFLDVGGGSGAYSMAFVKAKKDIEATVFDLPSVITLTNYYLDKNGMGNKVRTMKGDYNFDPFESGHDMIFLSQILHSNSPEENEMLIEKCHHSLNKGGQLVVQEFVVDEDRTKPLHAAFFALNMLVATRGGDAYTEKEIKGWMQNTGIKNIKRKNTKFGTSLIIGKK